MTSTLNFCGKINTSDHQFSGYMQYIVSMTLTRMIDMKFYIIVLHIPAELFIIRNKGQLQSIFALVLVLI